VKKLATSEAVGRERNGGEHVRFQVIVLEARQHGCIIPLLDHLRALDRKTTPALVHALPRKQGTSSMPWYCPCWRHGACRQELVKRGRRLETVTGRVTEMCDEKELSIF